MFGFLQFKLGAAGDDIHAVFDEDLQYALEGEQARFAFHQCQHIDAEGGLKLGVFVQAVEHALGLRVALKLDDDAHTVAV